MKIRQLEVVNFKSYYGRQLIGPFNNHFTCIIGPNGNGKSNILDAMLFVFGFKSSKLRQDTLASLIHSSAFGQPDQAKVTVTFVEQKNDLKNIGKKKSSSFASTIEEISVSRTIRRNGYSFYQLNDKKIQWGDLKQFLIKKGIDLEKNLFIILQGEVERLCQLSPEKLVEYIEYISGSDQYLQKINMLQNEYINNGVDLEVIKQRMGISRKVYNQSQKQTFELLKHIQLKIKLVQLDFLITKKSCGTSVKDIEKYKNQLQIQTSKLEIVQKYLVSLIKEHQQLQKVLSENQKNIQRIKTQIQLIESDLSILESKEIKVLESERQFLIKDMKQKLKEIEIIQKQKQDLQKMMQNQKQIRQKGRQIQEILNQIFSAQQDKQKRQIKQEYKQQEKPFNRLKSANKKMKNYNKQQKSHEKNKQKQQNEKNKSQKKEGHIDKSNMKSNKKGFQLNQKFFKARQAYKLMQQVEKNKQLINNQLNKQIEQKQKVFEETNKSYEKVTQKYGKKGEKYSSNTDNNIKLKIKIRQFSQAQVQSQSKLQKINSNIQQIRRRILQSESTKTILSNQQKLINEVKMANRVKIIVPHMTITTLRQHVILPVEDTQFFNAIIPHLDFIVTQTVEQANQILNFIKSNKLGRMTFIIKNQVNKIMQGTKTELKGQLPKGCRRMFDIVKIISKDFQKIWFWAVGNTLIAETTQNAMKAAYNNNPSFRVISMQGVFIDVSGTMTKVPLNKTTQMEDRAILQTRLKVLSNNFEQQKSRALKIKTQKQQIMRELNTNLSVSQQFSSISEVQQHLITQQQQVNQLSKALRKIKLQKIQLTESIQKKQKQISEIKQHNELQSLKEWINFSQLMKLIDEYEKISAKIKKIQISEQIIKNHKERIVKSREQMYLLNDRISLKKQQIQLKEKLIKQKKAEIKNILTTKKGVQMQSSNIQQKLFVKDLDIKYLKGEIIKEYKEKTEPFKIQNKKKQNKNKKQPKQTKKSKQTIDQSISSDLPQLEIFSGRKNKKYNHKKQKISQNQQHQSDLESEESQAQIDKFLPSASINSIRKEQKRIKQVLAEQQNKLIKSKKNYDLQIKCLSNLFFYLIKKCKDGEVERQKQIKQLQFKNQSRKNQKMQVQEIQQSIENNQKNFVKNDKNENKQTKQLKQSIPKLIKFQDVMIDYFQSIGLKHNLKKYSQNEMKQQTQKIKQIKDQTQTQQIIPLVKQNKNGKMSLKRMIQSQKSQQKYPEQSGVSDLIYKGFFNNMKILNIGPSDEYFFTHFITNNQYQTITDICSLVSQKIGKNVKKSARKATKRSKELQEEQENPEQQILDLIQAQKLKFLFIYQKQQINQFQQKSNSLYLKSGRKNKQISRIITSTYKKKQKQQKNNNKNKHHSRDNFQKFQQQDNQLFMDIKYFEDPQFPLDPYQLDMLQEYIHKKNQFVYVQKQFTKMSQSQKKLYTQLLQIRQLRTNCYLSTFNLINIQVNKIYNFLTKGNAEINLSNSINPFQGAQFSVRPFNKSWKSVNLLSGGEKTLTSLALIFACEQIKKFPFYFMDEIDAALDYRNVTNLGLYVKAKISVQHIVISLRKNMYEQCDALICIYKINDITNSIRVDMKDLYGQRREIQWQQQKEEEGIRREQVEQSLGEDSTQTNL